MYRAVEMSAGKLYSIGFGSNCAGLAKWPGLAQAAVFQLDQKLGAHLTGRTLSRISRIRGMLFCTIRNFDG